MQEISLMKKIIPWSINEMVVKKRDIRSTDAFSPLVNSQVPSNTRKLVSIVHMIETKEDKPYLLYDCENTSVNSME